jgi:hypothetical protein
MKQYEAVIQALEILGGQATLAELYMETMKITDCNWGTKTPFASIRRIVQTRPEIFKVRPGLWALGSYKKHLGLLENEKISRKEVDQSHAFYQGMLVIIGNLRGFSTYIPNQDKNKLFVKEHLKEIRSLQEIPKFSYDYLVKKSSTIDVIWFNNRLMPDSFFEVEYSTNMQNSLIKFFDLQDFHARMVIVSHEIRRNEFKSKIEHSALGRMKDRINFLDYNLLVKQYEYEVIKANYTFTA